ncbi:MAG: type II toxin-antitoxin system VapC family toxin [Nocardioidaceae bacterium]
MIYVDSSALLKLLFAERESTALAEWLAARSGTPVLSSELAKVEVIRACRRLDLEALPAARALLTQLDLIPLTTDVLDEAAQLGAPMLRSLDALHLAGALSIRADLSFFVAYDQRLSEAAATVGLESFQPGR